MKTGAGLNDADLDFDPDFDQKPSDIDTLVQTDDIQLFTELYNDKHIDFYRYLSAGNKWGEGENLDTYERLLCLSMLCHWLIINSQKNIFQDLQKTMISAVNLTEQTYQLGQHLLRENAGNAVYNTTACNNLIKNLLGKFDAVLNNRNNSSWQNKIKSGLDFARLNVDLIFECGDDRQYAIDSFKNLLLADKINASEFIKSLAMYRTKTKCFLAIALLLSIILLLTDIFKNGENAATSTYILLSLVSGSILGCFFLCVLRGVNIADPTDDAYLYYRHVLNEYTNLLIKDIKTKQKAGLFFSQRDSTQGAGDIEMAALPFQSSSKPALTLSNS